ncbi:MAG TPA: NnrU family protein [Burkholderiales bacterium]|nr:NnrU family protein [Burkholderiales bacterium]
MDPYILYASVITFLATHFISSTPLRPLLAQAIGERGYLVAYSLVAFAALGWMIWAFVRVPPEPLWPGLRLAPALVMPFAFMLMAGGLLTRNPSAVGQAKALKAGEPARGMLRITRHPMMWGFMLWAAAHIVARGELKATVFFGAFLVLAALGALAIDRRKEKTLGEDWRRFAAATSYFPFLAIAQGRNRFDAREIGWRIPAIGLALYAAFLWLHPLLFGLRPY